MKRKVLFFFPHNPWPPRSGAHKRALEMLACLRELGCDITFLSSTLSSDTRWEKSSVEGLKKSYAQEVRIYEGKIWDKGFRKYIMKYYRFFKLKCPLESPFYTPPGMRLWFWRIFKKFNPDIILMAYVHWDRLLNHTRNNPGLLLVDNHDLVTLCWRFRCALSKYVPFYESLAFNEKVLGLDDIADAALKEDFFDAISLTAEPEEFAIYDKYDYTIAISAKEAEIIQRNTKNTKVLFIPMTHEPCYISNRYAGAALFSTGPNSFNIQGYFYFVKKVLPLVRKAIPSFSIQVTGAICPHVACTENVLLSGFIPDLKTAYESARFSVCPILGATGQQVKIVEAMAYGLPVIALRNVAEASPLQHGVNGFVAHNADEFAEYAIQLWHNRKLCRKLGEAARDTIAHNFSRAQLIEKLSPVVIG